MAPRKKRKENTHPTHTYIIHISYRPTADEGGEMSHAPDSFCFTAKSRAVDLASNLWRRLLKDDDSTTGESQSFCFVVSSSVGWGSVVKFCQTIRASCIIDGMRIDNEMDSGKKCRVWRIEAQPVAEARKADSASMTVLWIPRPPALIGRVAWSQESALSWMLQMLSRRDRKTLSNVSSKLDW